MSAKWKHVAVLAVLAATSAVVLLIFWSLTIESKSFAAVGPEGVKSGGWIALALSVMSTGGFGFVTVIEAIRTWLSSNVPPGQVKDALLASVDVIELRMAANTFNGITDPVAKAKMWEVCFQINQAGFAKQFPKPAESTP